ncbi:terminase small subunit [Streptococcus anginosus]|uniref:terminase small subunit n=1 Tax=Streptococcus anginosus TaxID=1328 RepID=UPI0012458216|nr:terminase small subunit [Streptococcus anginosus]KAA9259758.1 terminase [Streptococcus anginosus]MDB8660515.1 terminase small subunit [Streptococcus anginosus]HEQ0291666.1 terminase small subunit [Streptococcus pyogenes]HES7273716.1 terminase small subunit [Streptococcus pyogenes]
MDKLTPKQELFVQGIISGLSQRQAYRQAYKAEKMTDVAVDVQASKLLKNPKITLRYRELLKQFSNMSLWSREQAFNEYEWLKNKARASIERDGVRQANSNAFLSALDGMNSMTWKDLKLTDEKIRQEIELLKIKIESNQGSKSDTSLMMALLDAVKGGDEVAD